MDLIWRSEKIINWQWCHFAPIVPNFLRAKIYPNNVVINPQTLPVTMLHNWSVAIMKKFKQLVMLFHWLWSPWRRANISR